MSVRLGGVVIASLVLPSTAFAGVLRVPEEHPTIQDAVNAATAGDEIRVGPGSYCGAVIDRPVRLTGGGRAVIVGCDTGPSVAGVLRVGFYMPDTSGTNPASGTHVSGFVFDGRGVSNANLSPLALGVLARFANDVHVTSNLFLGTTQAITNTAGDRWVVAHNRIRDLALFDCTGTFCSGGVGVTIQIALSGSPPDSTDPANRPEGNVVFDNDIEGTIPDGFDVFSMVGIFVFAADGTVITQNRVAIPENPKAGASGEGIEVDNNCCGLPTPVTPGARNTTILADDGTRSEFAIVVEGTGGANTQGLVLFDDRGVEVVEGVVTHQPAPLRMPRHDRPGGRRHHVF